MKWTTQEHLKELFFFFFFNVSSVKLGHVELGHVELPQPGIEPASPTAEAQNLNHWTCQESPYLFILEAAYISALPPPPSMRLCHTFVKQILSSLYSVLQLSSLPTDIFLICIL